jgi:hypothetical protein
MSEHGTWNVIWRQSEHHYRSSIIDIFDGRKVPRLSLQMNEARVALWHSLDPSKFESCHVEVVGILELEPRISLGGPHSRI